MNLNDPPPKCPHCQADLNALKHDMVRVVDPIAVFSSFTVLSCPNCLTALGVGVPWTPIG